MSALLAPLLARVWPPVPAHLLPQFWAAFLLVPAVYALAARRYTTRRKRAWIATALASGCMTLCSVPFVLDWVRSGFDVRGVRERAWLSESVCAGFMGYLVSDLCLGALCYPEHVSLLMGWIHHTLYFLLLAHVLAQRWGAIFAFAAAMELPTHLLALATLEPALRNDYLFAGTFFALRIAFHATLIGQYALPSMRTHVLSGKPDAQQWGPGVFLALALPMHVVWFYGCVKGMVRRAKQKRAKAQAALAVTATAPTQPLSEGIPATAEPATAALPAGLAPTDPTPSAEKLLAFPPSAARAIGLPTPGLTPHASPAFGPVRSEADGGSDAAQSPSPSQSQSQSQSQSEHAGADADAPLTPPITPPTRPDLSAAYANSSSSYGATLPRPPSLLALPSLYLPSREELRQRLGSREGRKETMESLRRLGRRAGRAGLGVVGRVTGAGAAGAAGEAALRQGTEGEEGVEVEQEQEEQGERDEGLEGSELRRRQVVVGAY